MSQPKRSVTQLALDYGLPEDKAYAKYIGVLAEYLIGRPGVYGGGRRHFAEICLYVDDIPHRYIRRFKYGGTYNLKHVVRQIAFFYGNSPFNDNLTGPIETRLMWIVAIARAIISAKD